MPWSGKALGETELDPGDAHPSGQLRLGFGVSSDHGDGDLQRAGQAGELAPGRVAQAPLDAREICRVHVSRVSEAFDRHAPPTPQAADRAAQLGVGGHSYRHPWTVAAPHEHDYR